MASAVHRSPYGKCSTGYTPIAIANFSVLAVLTAIYLPLIGLRFYARKTIVKSLWLDDWAMLAAVTLLLPYTALTWYCLSQGLGEHLGCFPTSQAINIVKASLPLDMLVILCLMFARASVGLLLVRLFAISKFTKVALYSLIVFQGLVMLATAALVIPRCQPVNKLWNPKIKGECWSKHVSSSILYLNGAVSIFTDFALAIAPVIFMRKIQMSLWRKLSVCFLLGLGFLPAASSFARTIFEWKGNAADATYSVAYTGIFITIEACCVVIAGTIPTLRTFFTRKKGSSYTYTSENSGRKIRPQDNLTSSLPTSSTSRQASQPSLHQQKTQDGLRRQYSAYGQATAERRERDMDFMKYMRDGEIARIVDVDVV